MGTQADVPQELRHRAIRLLSGRYEVIRWWVKVWIMYSQVCLNKDKEVVSNRIPEKGESEKK